VFGDPARWEKEKGMREILFRGKRKQDGKWVEGAYLPPVRGYPLNVHASHAVRVAVHTIRVVGRSGLFKWHEVIPETVGQYTGLNDINGAKIFEGDMVKTNEGRNWSTIREVRWVNVVCGFSPFYAINVEYEVVGNIYDNPEFLLEKKRE
jgi:hypothetical protein